MKSKIIIAAMLLSSYAFAQKSYCPTGRKNPSLGSISSVLIQSNHEGRISKLENSSTFNESGYTDFTQQSPPAFFAGDNVIAVVRSATDFPPSGDDFYLAMWIDYNQDGTFTDDELLGNMIYQSGSGNMGGGGTPIPGNAVIGRTRMRISVSTESQNVPCGTLEAGEVEDYSIVIARPTVTGTEIVGENKDITVDQTGSSFKISHASNEEFSYLVYSLQGVSYLNGSGLGTKTIDLSSLPRGIYVIEVSSKKIITSKKIILQ